MLFEEVIVSSNGRVLERIRHAQYIQWFLKQYEMSRPSKARLGKREGFDRFEDSTVQFNTFASDTNQILDDAGNPVPNRSGITKNAYQHSTTSTLVVREG